MRSFESYNEFISHMICGSIGYGGVDKIRRMYAVLNQKGFDIVGQYSVYKVMGS
jgi:hypothetical protein